MSYYVWDAYVMEVLSAVVTARASYETDPSSEKGETALLDAQRKLCRVLEYQHDMREVLRDAGYPDEDEECSDAERHDEEEISIDHDEEEPKQD